MSHKLDTVAGTFTEDDQGNWRKLDLVHKAEPGSDDMHCAVCMARIRRVPGGDGPVWVHADSGAVAAPGSRAMAEAAVVTRLLSALQARRDHYLAEAEASTCQPRRSELAAIARGFGLAMDTITRETGNHGHD